MPYPAPLDDAAHYLALQARDGRFDGRFFTGVTSTGIYCRPVCKVRTPRRENCRFFALAAQAELAGFRPCLRCRPELAPHGGETEGAPWSVHEASGILAREAARLLDASVSPWVASEQNSSADAVSQRLGISERHLRRIFAAHWGVSPLQYLQTRRLLAAKQLLTDTDLGVAQVAHLSGFASLRRFNAVFVAHYRLQPTALRTASASTTTSTTTPKTAAHSGGFRLQACYRPPYDISAMLGFLGQRGMDGVEWVDVPKTALARTLAIATAGERLRGWVHCQFDETQHRVALTVSASLAPVLPQVLARLRAWLDLDADPLAINAAIGAGFPGLDGLRVPGTTDGFELAVRAILGQQVTVAAGRTFAQRLVQRWGEEVATPWPGLNKLFPSAQALVGANPSELGALGLVRQRQQALIALAQAVCQGQIDLTPGADVTATVAQLQALPGIGPWTAHYIAMRALRWPDALPASDVALHKALGVRHSKSPALELERIFAAWTPWRSYAVIRAWHTLAYPGAPAS
jgi:AraC family transcriptional regulator of adaptative response / DNA-3-methyladenine glycosylase II